MSSIKKRIIITTALAAGMGILILLGVIFLITKSFIIDVILHVLLRMLWIPFIIIILRKCFKEMLSDNLNKALVLWL